MMEAKNTEPNVIICGGGPCGFLSSILLSKLGIRSTVLDRALEADAWSAKSYSMVCREKGSKALERADCLEAARENGIERSCVYIVDGQSGTIKKVPRPQSDVPTLSFSRPQLVECLETKASSLPNLTVKRGIGISHVELDSEKGDMRVYLEDGTMLPATHVIGADGKWSRVRQSFQSLNNSFKMVTCPSFGVSMFVPVPPEDWERNGTYVVQAPKEYGFYLVASHLSNGGMSISMVCFDSILEKYPWLEPPAEQSTDVNASTSWEEEHSSGISNDCETGDSQETPTLSDRLEALFREAIPGFHMILQKQAYKSARINRRVSWLKMLPAKSDGIHESNTEALTYATAGGRVVILGDAAHAMTPSLGEGGNTAMESALKLADTVSSVMKEQQETTCSLDTLTCAFLRFGLSRPREVQPVQERSAAGNQETGG